MISVLWRGVCRPELWWSSVTSRDEKPWADRLREECVHDTLNDAAVVLVAMPITNVSMRFAARRQLYGGWKGYYGVVLITHDFILPIHHARYAKPQTLKRLNVLSPAAASQQPS